MAWQKVKLYPNKWLLLGMNSESLNYIKATSSKGLKIKSIHYLKLIGFEISNTDQCGNPEETICRRPSMDQVELGILRIHLSRRKSTILSGMKGSWFDMGLGWKPSWIFKGDPDGSVLFPVYRKQSNLRLPKLDQLNLEYKKLHKATKCIKEKAQKEIFCIKTIPIDQ